MSQWPTSKRYQDYHELIVMELLGYTEEEEDAPWFHHGKAMEPFARGAYEWKYDVELNNDLFLIHKDYDWLGASPDGVFMPDYDNMVEIKCRKKLETYLAKLVEQERTGKIEAAYRPQVQCQLAVSGLPSLEFVNYYHDDEQKVRKLHRQTVHRDEAMIDRIIEKGLEFILKCYERAEVLHDKSGNRKK
jgi:putative phage-type endonuclease